MSQPGQTRGGTVVRDDIIAAHKHCTGHRSEVLASPSCGCFYCLTTFTPSEITRWVDEHDGVGQTALCPRCGIDSVLGSESGYPITPEFLNRMHQHWFETTYQASAIDTGQTYSSPLFRDRSFWGMTATQFLGAFNDNVFKQLMLLLAIPVGAAAVQKADEQGLATMIFSLPFVLFSGFAGWLSDRYSKRNMIVVCKIAEIGIMLLGMLAFLSYGTMGYRGLLVVLFLMGTHSAFFGPGKYGILPELFREEDLPRANGVILMTTFLAIIFGTASAGLLGELLYNAAGQRVPERLWIGSMLCIGIAICGTITSLLVRPVRAAVPGLRFQPSGLFIPADTAKLLAADRPLLAALLVSCVFWLFSGFAMQSVNSLGMTQLAVGERKTSLLTAVIGLGIAAGAVLAGRLSRGKADFRLVTWGGWGMVVGMLIMAISLPQAGGGFRHLLGYGGSFPMLVLLGMAAGMFAIPVQVFIQSRPPEDQKGRMIAAMNLTNFIAILLSGAIYMACDRVIESLHWPRSVLFAFNALVILPVALLYRPPESRGQKSEVVG